jgi:NAD(P)H-dependent flavin oxidoreductase YrpB (nitropropane dioxygenase family)
VSFTEQLGLEHPIVQAGMGGGIATGALAGEVSAAGGLGTVGILPPERLRTELESARDRAEPSPIAANLLIPFATRAHLEACRGGGARVVVLHGGFKRSLIRQLKEDGAVVLHTVGTADEARRALAEGADGLVAQGIEAGGHLMGVESALDALPRILDVAGRAPVLLAGGIADHGDVRRALGAGAAAAVAGTRFLLTEECAAHPEYKRRVLAAQDTLETLLFGFGWPMRHRVIPNAATERWCKRDPRGPRAMRALNALSGPVSRLPMSLANTMAQAQRPAIPILSPAAPLVGMPDQMLDAAPLYAGETALRIDDLVPAAQAVQRLAGTISA